MSTFVTKIDPRGRSVFVRAAEEPAGPDRLRPGKMADHRVVFRVMLDRPARRGDRNLRTERIRDAQTERGEGDMASIERTNLDSPDQATTPFEGGLIESLTVAGVTLLRETLQPGWRWSEHVKPIVGGDSCQKRHLKLMVSGQQHVVMNDGTEMELVPGDFAVIEPGHDAWVVGDEPNVLLEMVAIER